MNIATERFEKEILLEQPIIKNNHYQDTATIGAHLEKCTFMKELSSRIGKIDNVVRISRQHMHRLDFITAYFKI